MALRREPAQGGGRRDFLLACWPRPVSGLYPRGSEAVADLRWAEVLLDCLLVGKPLRRQETGEPGHRAAVPVKSGQEGPVGARLRPVSAHGHTGRWNARSLNPPRIGLSHCTASPLPPPGPHPVHRGRVLYPSVQVTAVWVYPQKRRLRCMGDASRRNKGPHLLRRLQSWVE